MSFSCEHCGKNEDGSGYECGNCGCHICRPCTDVIDSDESFDSCPNDAQPTVREEIEHRLRNLPDNCGIYPDDVN